MPNRIPKNETSLHCHTLISGSGSGGMAEWSSRSQFTYVC